MAREVFRSAVLNLKFYQKVRLGYALRHNIFTIFYVFEHLPPDLIKTWTGTS